MKNKIIYTIFLALAFIFLSGPTVMADVVRSEDDLFVVEVGEDGYIRPSYNRASIMFPGEDSDSFVRNFNVKVNAKLENTNADLPTDPIYLWRHTMCFTVNGEESECEVDEVTINALRSYPNYSFWANKEKIPFFKITERQSIIVTFKNEFICQDNCNTGNIILDDVILIVDDGPVLLLDESSLPDESLVYESALNLKFNFYDILGLDETSLKFAWQRNLNYDDVNTPFENGVSFSSRPTEFLSNKDETFYLVISAIDVKGYSSALFYRYTFKSLQSINIGGDSILPKSDLFYSKFYFNIKDDNFINYKYAVLPYSSNYFLNLNNVNIIFNTNTDINPTVDYYGNQLTNNSYYLYITFEDEFGNKYGNIYEFKMDITLPSVRSSSFPDTSSIYQQISGRIDFTDNRSGLNHDKLFYLFSSEEIDLDNDYELINLGYKNNSELTSPKDINDTWYLYFLVYDQANNMQIFYFEYEFDNIPPSIIEERTKNDPSLISSDHSVYINITDLNGLESESFLCGWFLKGVEVTNSYTLKDNCLNKTFVNSPKGLEGQYFLWFYVSDIVGNFAYLRSENVFSIDTKVPELLYDIVNDHLEYSEINEVFINFSDSYSGIDETSFKYKWLPKGETPSSSNILENKFNNESYIKYPFNYYGEFRLWLSAKDNAGNEYFAPLNEVFKIDTGIITLDISGESTIKLIRGEKFTDPGATAYKGESLYNGRIIDVGVNTNLDLSKPGTYFIEYTSGEGANRVVVTRTVIVEESHYLIIILVIAFISGLSTYIYQLIRKSRHN